jgi:hypothetical protein
MKQPVFIKRKKKKKQQAHKITKQVAPGVAITWMIVMRTPVRQNTMPKGINRTTVASFSVA